MKKYFIILILPFYLLTSCRAESIKLYEHSKYEEALELVNSNEHPSSQDYLAKFLSLNELQMNEEKPDTVLLYLLTTNDQSSSVVRQTAVTQFLEYGFSDELCILCLEPNDGTEAQIRLYKAYSSIKDLKNSRLILDNYLSKQLENKELIELLIEYPSDLTYTMGVFEKWFENLDTSEKQEFSNLLYNFTFSENLTEQCAVSIIRICSENENDRYFTSSSQSLINVYRTHVRALEVIGDNKTANSYNEKIYKLTKRI